MRAFNFISGLVLPLLLFVNNTYAQIDSGQAALLEAVGAMRSAMRVHGDMVRVAGDVVLKETDSCSSVVAILGNASIEGKVAGDAVVISGNMKVSGIVNGQVVVVGGKIDILPGAVVRGGIVNIGSRSNIDSAATVTGESIEIGAFLNGIFANIREYFIHCLFKGRFIAPELPWTIFAFLSLFFVALLLAALFRNFYGEAVTLIGMKPGMVLCTGLLALVAMPVLSVILSVTVVGIPVIPVVHLFVFGIGLLGLYALFTHVGMQLLSGGLHVKNASPILAGLMVAAVFILLAMVPIAGIFIVALAKIIGTGAGVFTLFKMINKSKQNESLPFPETPKPDAAPPQTDTVPIVQNVQDRPAASHETASVDRPDESGKSATGIRPGTLLERLGAIAVDFFMIAIVHAVAVGPFFSVISFIPGRSGSGGSTLIFLFLVYLIVMWAGKGTTFGNIIFHLKVQRIGGGAISWGVAVVRALGAILSTAPLGLGFFWMAWDQQRQTWHDKIAGTEVVRMPKGVNLL